MTRSVARRRCIRREDEVGLFVKSVGEAGRFRLYEIAFPSRLLASRRRLVRRNGSFTRLGGRLYQMQTLFAKNPINVRRRRSSSYVLLLEVSGDHSNPEPLTRSGLPVDIVLEIDGIVYSRRRLLTGRRWRRA